MPQNLWGSLVLEIQWSWRLGIDFDYWEEAAAVVVGLDLPAAGIDIVDWGLGKFDCHTDRTWAVVQAAQYLDQTEPAAVVADIAVAEAVDIVVDWDPHHLVAHTDYSEPAENY